MPKTTKKQAKDNVLGWKIATIVCAVLAVAGCATAAVLFFSRPKDVDSESDAFASLDKIVDKSDDKYTYEVKYFKKGTTKDNKYYYAFVSSSIKDMDGAWGNDVYFRKTAKGSEWQSYNIANDSNPKHFPYCNEISGDLADFIKNYDYVDDDINQVWVTCWDEGGKYQTY